MSYSGGHLADDGQAFHFDEFLFQLTPLGNVASDAAKQDFPPVFPVRRGEGKYNELHNALLVRSGMEQHFLPGKIVAARVIKHHAQAVVALVAQRVLQRHLAGAFVKAQNKPGRLVCQYNASFPVHHKHHVGRHFKQFAVASFGGAEFLAGQTDLSPQGDNPRDDQQAECQQTGENGENMPPVCFPEGFLRQQVAQPFFAQQLEFARIFQMGKGIGQFGGKFGRVRPQRQSDGNPLKGNAHKFDAGKVHLLGNVGGHLSGRRDEGRRLMGCQALERASVRAGNQGKPAVLDDCVDKGIVFQHEDALVLEVLFAGDVRFRRTDQDTAVQTEGRDQCDAPVIGDAAHGRARDKVERAVIQTAGKFFRRGGDKAYFTFEHGAEHDAEIHAQAARVAAVRIKKGQRGQIARNADKQPLRPESRDSVQQRAQKQTEQNTRSRIPDAGHTLPSPARGCRRETSEYLFV